MKLSKRTEYGLKAAMRLTNRYGSGYVQSREIAQAERLPAKFLESILLGLRSARLLESKVGAGGGYRLSRSPDQIGVSEVIAALEPGEADDGTAAVPDDDANAPTVGGEALSLVNHRLRRAFDDAVSEWSLAELQAEAEAQTDSGGPLMYHI